MTALVETQAAVIGGGPAGLVAALALAHFRVPTVLVARRAAGMHQPAPQPTPGSGHAPSEIRAPSSGTPSTDNRTTALIGTSVAALDALGVWARCRGAAAPLRVLRIADDAGRLCRAPEMRFDAAEIGLEAFGWNIENVPLLAALWDRAAVMPGLNHIDDEARSIEIGSGDVTVRLGRGAPLRCRLVIGADGRNSICRAAAGIAVDSRDLSQTALTFTLGHTRPHRDISTEFHTAQGPFTLVPLPGLRSSLVWVLASRQAPRFEALAGDALDREIERRCHSILGKVRAEPGHGAFTLRVATARRLAARRVALVGEAAHLFPPIGAQGLNLGLRDAAAVAELAGDITRAGGDIGAEAAMDAYERARRVDVRSRSVAVDLLNRSLLSDFLPVQFVRGFGLYGLARVGPLRRAAMREGVAPFAAMPQLMRSGRPLR